MDEAFLKIPSEYQVNRNIPLDRIYGKETEKYQKIVSNIIWLASLVPGIAAVDAVENEKVRYQEIQIISLQIEDTSELFPICRPIYRGIPYPCVLIIHYKNKACIGTCPFTPAKQDYNQNVLKNLVFSHWIYPDSLSEKANNFLNEVNRLLRQPGSLLEIYQAIHAQILYFGLSGLTKAHVGRLLRDLTGKTSIPNLLDTCTPYRKRMPYDSSRRSRYDTKARRCGFQYRYDTEDLWYAFNQDVTIHRVIAGRQYKDIDELIFRIDDKCNSEK